ncbi:MAG: hypothetical protein AMS24_01055 [Chlamydiae bacterium SM23_39]|nr:MAG: hypothetical protein AMS24_01055 [Chlamydiae bacterium SM23_39]
MENIEKYLSQCPTYPHWKRIGIKNHHGFCIILSSIRSKKSCGIGEYTDLLPLIDWCKKIDMDVIQLLPINECYFKDYSPYNAISSCALDPIYLGLESLPFLEENRWLKDQIKSFKKYNHTRRVKFDKVRKKKLKWLKTYYNIFSKKFQNSSSYISFIKQNFWLKPYSVFRVLKDYNHGKKWYRWKKNIQNPDERTVENIFLKFNKNTKFYIFLQYLSFNQMMLVKNYATKNNVLIKGDIPILINPDSVDVWYYRSFFDLSHIAGAPPDDFNIKGHKWGFFLFNWQALKDKNYSWWKQKLLVITNIYHLYRIDHAVGFFRIWAIKKKDKAIHGQFLPRNLKIWRKQGEEHLKMLIKFSPLLPIAEDLGFIPNMVYSSLKSLGICGTKVPRWEKKINMRDYEPISLTTLSTHDTETNDLWWQSHKKNAKTLSKTNLWPYQEKLTFELKKRILYDTHHSASIFHINLLQEYLSLFQELVDKNAKNERINISGVIKKSNWTYRIKPTIEELLSNEKLINVLKDIVN